MLAKDEILQSRYRIVRQLGRGGMGAVYEAVDERFGTPVALKEILVELHDWADQKHQNSMVKAFEREAKSLAQARHEAIPFVRDYFGELNRQFLVMELVEGDDLAESLVKRGAPFALEEALNWADQLLDALDYLHNLQPPIIHRDIKPQNLKLSFRRKIKLLDFGIAKSGDGTQTITNQTFVGATLNYSPIEQILRVIDPTFREFIKLKHREKTERVLSQNTDARCDIYALGATFYHLLTNRPPMDSTTRTLEIWEGKTDPLLNPSELNPTVPPSVSACLLKAMEIERERRFSTAAEMQIALQSSRLPAQSQAVPPTDPQISVPKVLTGGSSKQAVPDTLPSAEFTKTEPLATARLDSPLIYDNKIYSAPATNPERKSGSKRFWMLPTAAVCIAAAGGIGGIIWQNNPTSTDASRPAANAVISAPTAAATSLPTTAPTTLPLVSPTPDNADKPDEKIKPPIAAPPNEKLSQNPIKKSPPKTPKPEKRNTGDDCIYNGKCN